jgi:hypothetical protein
MGVAAGAAPTLGERPQEENRMKANKTKAEKSPTTEAAPASKSAKKGAKPKKLSAIDAAAKVLGETGQSMRCPEMIEAMAKKGYWKSPGGKTPAETLYAAILKEIATKGKESRFVKIDRGQFGIAKRH